jgi:hypothetical protein
MTPSKVTAVKVLVVDVGHGACAKAIGVISSKISNATTAKATQVSSTKATHSASAKATDVASAQAAHAATMSSAAAEAAHATTVSSAAAATTAPGLCAGRKQAPSERCGRQNCYHSSFHDILHLDGRICRHRSLSDIGVSRQSERQRRDRMEMSVLSCRLQ